MKRFLRRLFWLSLVFSLLYTGGYGMARWRKLLVLHEFPQDAIKGGPPVYEVAAGHDLRTKGVGAFKNAIAPTVALAYTPCRMLEATCRNLRQSHR